MSDFNFLNQTLFNQQTDQLIIFDLTNCTIINSNTKMILGKQNNPGNLVEEFLDSITQKKIHSLITRKKTGNASTQKKIKKEKLNQRKTAKECVNSCMNILCSFWRQKDSISEFDFEKKLELTKGFIMLLKNVLELRNYVSIVYQSIEGVLSNVGAYITWMTEPLLLNLYCSLLISFYNNSNYGYLAECCEKMLQICETINDQNYKQKSFLILPELNGPITENRKKLLDCLISNHLAQLSKQRDSETQMAYMYSMITSNSYSHFQNLYCSFETALNKHPDLIDHVLRILTICNQNDVCKALRQTVCLYVTKIVKQNRMHPKLLNIVHGCLQLFIANRGCSIYQKIISTIIITTSTNDSFIQPIHYFAEKWNHNNDHHLYYVSCIYSKSFEGSPNIQNFAAMAQSIEKLKQSEGGLSIFDPVFCKIIVRFQPIILVRFEEISKWKKIKSTFKNDQCSSITKIQGIWNFIQFAKLVMRVFTQHIQNVKSKKNQRYIARDPQVIQFTNNIELILKLVIKSAFIYLTEIVLWSINQDKWLQFSGTEEAFSLISQSPSESQGRSIRIFINLAFVVINLPNISRKNRKQIKIIVDLFFNQPEFLFTFQHSQISQILENSDSEERGYIVQKMLKYIHINKNNPYYCSVIGDIASQMIVLIKKNSFQFSKLVQKLEDDISSFQSELENCFISHLQEELINFNKNLQRSNLVRSLDTFIQLFDFYRQFMIKKIQENQSKYYIEFYQVVNLHIYLLQKCLTNCTRQKENKDKICEALEKLNLSLIMQGKHSPYDTFLEMEDDFQKYDFPHYINVFAKQIHLIVVNKGSDAIPLNSDWQIKYQDLCRKSVQIIRKIKKIETYLDSKSDKSGRIKNNRCILQYGSIEFSSDFTLHELKCLMNNLDVLIYYTQQLIPAFLNTFVAMKVSISVMMENDQDYENLDEDSRLRVVSQMMPLIRSNEFIHSWGFYQVDKIDRKKIVNQDIKKLYPLLRQYFANFNDKDTKQTNDIKFMILKNYTWKNSSVGYSQAFIKELMLLMINGHQENGDTSQNYSFRFNKVNQLRLPVEFIGKKVIDFYKNPMQFYDFMFFYEEMFDFDKACPHFFCDYHQRLMELMACNNQPSIIKNLFDASCNVLYRSYSLFTSMKAMQYLYKKYNMSFIFDSTVHIFKEMGLNVRKLDKIRFYLFGGRKSVRYSIGALAQDLMQIFQESFNDVFSTTRKFYESFIIAILKYYGEKNHIELYIVYDHIRSLLVRGDEYEIHYTKNLMEHFDKTKVIPKHRIQNLKASLFNLIAQEMLKDYRKAMEYRYLLGKLHHHFQNSLLNESQILQLSFLPTQFNFIYKKRLLEQTEIGVDQVSFQRMIETLQTNQKRVKIQLSYGYFFHMLQHIKKIDNHFVVISTLGDQVVTITITQQIDVSYTCLNDFVDLMKDTENIVKQCNKRLDIQQKQLFVKTWWEKRHKGDKRIEVNVNQVSCMPGINFIDQIYSAKQEHIIKSYKNKSKFSKVKSRNKKKQSHLQKNENEENLKEQQQVNPPKKIKQTIFLVDDELQNFPYECMEYIHYPQSSPKGIYRIPAIGYLNELKEQKNTIVNMSNLSYLVNPESNLTATQTRFNEMKKDIFGWKGMVGERPSPQQFLELLKSEVFLYMGHGNGKYVTDDVLFKKKVTTVPLLYGCSSARMVDEGGSEAHGFCLTYLLSGCSLLLGCLWSVTDKDIDEFTLRIVDKFMQENGDFGGAVAESKEVCRMKYLNGAAIILYGLPRVFKFQALKPSQ